MLRKILMAILIFSLVVSSSYVSNREVYANPLLKEAIKWTIKETIKKETKSATEAILIKQGVRTTEGVALKKAGERWFQRLAAEEVAGVQAAVEAAVPSGTPGYLKTVVGIGFWFTGADLAYTIYDYLKDEKDVSYRSDVDDTYPDTLSGVKGLGNYYLDRELYREGNIPEENFYYFGLRSTSGRWVQFNSAGWFGWKHNELGPYSVKFVALGADMYHVTLLKWDAWQPPYEFKGMDIYLPDASSGGYLIQDNKGSFDWDETGATAPNQVNMADMPSNIQAAWPDDTQGVEIIFPDPNFFPDTAQTIIDNPEIITNPIPEPQPTPEATAVPTIQPTTNPDYTPEPTEGPTPSATPNPSVGPTSSAMPSSQPTDPPVVGGEDPNPTTPPDDDDDDDGANGPPIDSPLTPEEALALGWEDVTPPVVREYKDPKTGTVVKFDTASWKISYNKYYEVEIINTEGKPIGEIDEIDMEKEIFYEDKQAKGLNIINPSTGLPAQTAQQWADKQILVKTRNRIQALRDGTATRVTKNGSKIIPKIESIRNFKEFVFRLDGDSLELKQATENAVNLLAQEFPGYKFSATFGRK